MRSGLSLLTHWENIVRVENGHLVLERKACTNCKNGHIYGYIVCIACSGSGNGKRGGARGCKQCYGRGQVIASHVLVTCPHCNGNYANAESETYTDCVPDELYKSLTFQVVHMENQEQSWNECHLGIGYLFTVTTFGHKIPPDDELVEKVRSHRMVQACKLVDSAGKLASTIAILVKANGYSVRAV
jgi:hypothetical protein